jgi:predicted enzyme related to lactoylglutathione lyase
MSNFAYAKMHEFETTHIKGQAGTGVSGLFMEEAAFLNPASLSFFNAGDVYVQRDMLQIKDAAGNILQKHKNTGVVLADGNASVSGSLSYVKQDEGMLSRKRWGLSTSTLLDPKNALGVSIRKTKDEDLLAGTSIDYYQTVFGLTHALDQQTSLGLVAYDAFNSKGKATKAILGVQHAFVDAITVALDFGGNYKADDISNTLLYRGSLQVRVLDDFYIRFGAFDDKEQEEKGNAFGVGWISPKLALEFALKQTKQKASPALVRNETKLKETSFGLSYRF